MKSLRGYRFYGNKSFRIYSVEKEKIDIWKTISETPECKTTQAAYLSFDKRYITDYGTENLIVDCCEE